MSKNDDGVDGKITELENLLEWFESSDVTVEDALKNYERASSIAADLQEELEKAKNKVEVIKKKFA